MKSPIRVLLTHAQVRDYPNDIYTARDFGQKFNCTILPQVIGTAPNDVYPILTLLQLPFDFFADVWVVPTHLMQHRLYNWTAQQAWNHRRKLSTYLKLSLMRAMHSDATWLQVQRQYTAFRSLFTPKQAGEGLATRIRQIRDRVRQPQNEPSVQFYLSDPIDWSAFTLNFLNRYTIDKNPFKSPNLEGLIPDIHYLQSLHLPGYQLDTTLLLQKLEARMDYLQQSQKKTLHELMQTVHQVTEACDLPTKN